MSIATAPRLRTFPPSEFLSWEAVPVWAEHTIKHRDDEGKLTGVETVIDKAALERVIANCNDRIDETGDYAPIVIRHTRDPNDPNRGADDPLMVGFAGPFFLGRLGNKRPKWVINAEMHIFKRDEELVQRYPRVSVEYWSPLDDPTDGHFDPISLLGAETPQQDLGLRYSRARKSGSRLLVYQRELVLSRYDSAGGAAGAVFPGAGSGFVPSLSNEKKHDYQKEPAAMALSTEDVQQIVEALKPTMQSMVDDSLAFLLPAEESPTPADMAGEDQGNPAATVDASGAAGAPGAEGAAAAAAGANMGAAPPPSGTGNDLLAPDEGNPKAPAKEDLTPDRAALQKYMKDGNVDVAAQHLRAMDTKDREALEQQYSKMEDCDEKRFYSKCEETMKTAANPPNGGESEVTKYSRRLEASESLVIQYRRERDESRVQYAAVVAERDGLKTKLAETEARELKNYKYSRLIQRQGEGFVLDIDEEMSDDVCGKMSREMFDRHVEHVIVTRYERVPGVALTREPAQYTEPDPASDPNAVPAHHYADAEVATAKASRVRKYSRRAREYADKQRDRGIRVTHQEAMEWAEANDPATNGQGERQTKLKPVLG